MSLRRTVSALLRTSPIGAWQRLRHASWKARRRTRIQSYLAENSIRKLQIGAGFHSFQGWLNTDLEPRGPQFIFMDATEPFPLPDNSFDYIFTEHIIEHIPYLCGRSMLQESLRVLRPGGRIRIATPDLQVILALNTTPSSDAQQRYMRWITKTFLPEIDVVEPVFVINNAFRNWGHQFLYDLSTITRLLQQTGFNQITSCESGQSSDPVLRGIDSHGSCIADQEMNRFESMIVEARKPA